MTTAQQDADTAAPRELLDAAAAREKAKTYIEQFRSENGGALPSGTMVAEHCGGGLSGKWGQNQLKPFRPAETPSPAGAPPQRRSATVRELATERAAAAAAAGPGPATVAIGAAGTERPPAAAPVPPQRPAERSGPATGTPTGTPTGTAQPRTGTPTATSRTGTPTAALRSGGRSLGETLALLPLLAIAAGAFVSIWGGWVGLGKLTGFGEIELLPGITGWKFNTAITLPLGMEAYAAYALKVWLAPPASLSEFGRAFARRSAIGALILGAAGQIAYHLMAAAKVEHAHWLITAFVACLPVGVLGCGAALMHLVRHPERSRP